MLFVNVKVAPDCTNHWFAYVDGFQVIVPLLKDALALEPLISNCLLPVKSLNFVPCDKAAVLKISPTGIKVVPLAENM